MVKCTCTKSCFSFNGQQGYFTQYAAFYVDSIVNGFCASIQKFHPFLRIFAYINV